MQSSNKMKTMTTFDNRGEMFFDQQRPVGLRMKLSIITEIRSKRSRTLVNNTIKHVENTWKFVKTWKSCRIYGKWLKMYVVRSFIPFLHLWVEAVCSNIQEVSKWIFCSFYSQQFKLANTVYKTVTLMLRLLNTQIRVTLFHTTSIQIHDIANHWDRDKTKDQNNHPVWFTKD